MYLDQLDQAARQAVADYMERRAMWAPNLGDAGAYQDVAEWIANSDAHWLAGYVDASLGLRPQLYTESDDRLFYESGRLAFEHIIGARSAPFAAAARLAGLDPAEYASNYEKARAALAGAN